VLATVVKGMMTMTMMMTEMMKGCGNRALFDDALIVVAKEKPWYWRWW